MVAAKTLDSLLDAVGHTPLMQLSRAVPAGCGQIFAKLEAFNPGGSVKDRICLQMIEAAEQEGILKPGATVIEPTSGNTGIGLAWVCALKKHPLILVMPENYSVERRFMMRALGARIVLTEAVLEMPGAIAKAEALAAETPDAFLPRQFSNPHNPEAHELGTAQEILADLPQGGVDAFVAGVGTGGTLTGVGRILKRHDPRCKIVAVEPESAAVLSGRQPSVHRIQGIGAGFIPKILDLSLIDQIETVSDREAFENSKQLARAEGLLVGISSGAAFAAALRVSRQLGPESRVLTLFPDKGERYFSIEKYF